MIKRERIICPQCRKFDCPAFENKAKAKIERGRDQIYKALDGVEFDAALFERTIADCMRKEGADFVVIPFNDDRVAKLVVYDGKQYVYFPIIVRT